MSNLIASIIAIGVVIFSFVAILVIKILVCAGISYVLLYIIDFLFDTYFLQNEYLAIVTVVLFLLGTISVKLKGK